MYRTANTLPEQIRSKSVDLLNRHLAAAVDLHAQVKQAHWNVRGPTFIAIHELFDKVADAVEDYSDKIAERAGTLGGTAEGTVQTAAERSFLEPYWLGYRRCRGAHRGGDGGARELRGIGAQRDR